MMSLHPTDTIVIVDSPFGDPEHFPIPKLAHRYGARVLEVDKNPHWNFHQAYARRCGYEEAKHDLIFTMDADSTPTWNILKGLKLIGDNIGLVSFRKLLRFTPTFIFPNLYYLLKSYFLELRFSGVYWLNRPIYKDLMPKSLVRPIKNAEDTLLIEQLLESDYDYYFLREIGSISHDSENEQKPWRQFLNGVWFYTHRWNGPPRKGVLGAFMRMKIPLLAYRIGQTVAFNQSHMVKGYIWAKEHPDDPMVKEVEKMDTTRKLQYLGNISRGYGS